MKAALAAAALAVSLTGCTGSGTDETRVVVLAASSLTEAFSELERRFEADHPGVDVVLSLGSSTTLAQQAADGAPGDVLATADARSMSLAVDAGVAGDPDVFATNTLALVVYPDEPRGDAGPVTGMGDLDRADISYVTCVPSAPCGAVARAVLAENGVTQAPVSEEVDVRSVLARVVAGEADAGLVYRSDAVAAGDAVRMVDTAGAEEHPTDYLVAPLTGANALAEKFVASVLSAAGQQVLADAGFGPGHRT